MLSILIRNQQTKITFVSSTELFKAGKVIDPIMDEMYMIRFQPFHDVVMSLHPNDWKSPLQLSFKDWDRRLLNTVNKRRFSHV